MPGALGPLVVGHLKHCGHFETAAQVCSGPLEAGMQGMPPDAAKRSSVQQLRVLNVIRSLCKGTRIWLCSCR